MAIKLGNNDIELKVGSTDVDAIYLGSTLMYSGGTPPTPVFEGKYKLTLSDSSTVSAECDSTSAITSGEVSSQYSGTLVSAEIGSCVTSIGERAFRYCSSLTSVTIGSGITSIGGGAFGSCSGLTSIDIPDSVTSIGSGAFGSCSGMTSCTIGSGVTNIENYAFLNCTSLTSITILATTPPTLGLLSPFSNTPIAGGTSATGYIYVPSQSVNAYKTATKWNTYADRIQAIP